MAWGAPAAHGQWRARAGQVCAQHAATLRVGGFPGTPSVAAGASAVCARARWPPYCAMEAPRGGVAAGLYGARGGGGGLAAPRRPLYAVQGAPSAISGVGPRAVRAGHKAIALTAPGRADSL